MLRTMIGPHIVNRTIRLLLVAVFISVFPSGKTALSLCLDDEQAHLVYRQHLHLMDCHTAPGDRHPETSFALHALLEKNGEPCVDLMLSTYNSTTLRQRTSLTVPTPVLCALALVKDQQWTMLPAGLSQSSLLAQSSSVSPTVDAHRTVVLLI